MEEKEKKMNMESIEVLRLKKLIDNKRNYLSKLDKESRQASFLVSEISTLVDVLLALSASQNIFQTEINKDITKIIDKVQQSPLSHKLNGMLLYYQFQRDFSEKPIIALAGNIDTVNINLDLSIYTNGIIYNTNILPIESR